MTFLCETVLCFPVLKHIKDDDKAVPLIYWRKILIFAMRKLHWSANKQMCVCPVIESCPAVHDPMDCSPPGFFIHGIFQARLLEWAAISFSRTNEYHVLLANFTLCLCSWEFWIIFLVSLLLIPLGIILIHILPLLIHEIKLVLAFRSDSSIKTSILLYLVQWQINLQI